MKNLYSFFDNLHLHFKLLLLCLMAVVISLLCYQLFNSTYQNHALHQGFFAVLLYLLYALPVIIFVGLSFYYYSRHVMRRVHRLTTAAHSWSKGDFSVTVEDSSKDEIGQLTRHLNSMAQQLQETIAVQQELAVSNERNRLARELHDTVKQLVFALRFQVAIARKLHRADDDQLALHLEEAEKILQDIQKEMTNLIFPMRQALLENQALADSLAKYLSRWSYQYGIFVKFTADIQGLEKNFTFPARVKEALFRIAQEALSNVARHSNASSVQVTLTIGWLYITLKIADNGHGFDYAKQKERGVGLSSMEERITAIGGELQISSTPSHGTEVVATYKAKDPGPNVAEIPTYRSDKHTSKLPRTTQRLRIPAKRQ